jgi:hypothetical protein
MFKFFISICCFFTLASVFSQEKKSILDKNEVKDSVVYKSNYGLRVGLDISKPVLKLFDSDYSGFELVADYRVAKNYYIAFEIGYERETSNEDFTNSTTSGNYFRLGFNYNAYENWLDMNNEIYIGMRYGFSYFDQTLNSFTPNVIDPSNGIYFPSNQITSPIETNGLTAHWTEFVVGIKAETFKNLYFGFSFSYKVVLSIKDPENFQTLYAPGFNTVFQSDTGFGFNYTVSYIIPFFKK